MSVNPELAMPAPKFATQRDLSRPTRGGRAAAFGEHWLGQPFMPAQRLIADVAGELNPDGTPAYPLVVVTEPRQAGKTHLDMSLAGERCLSVPGFRSWQTAQTGGDARDAFLKFADENVAGRPLAHLVKVLRGNGHEVMKFPNLSTMRPHPPTESAMHGKQSDRNGVDEAWAFDEDEGKALMQAIAPTQLTRRGAQTFIWSAGGTAASTWLAALVARGRAGDPNIAYFEWGIPDDLPLDDLEAIAHYHPAFGHTINLAAIRNLRTILEDDSEFARAVGNRWTEVIGGAIPADDWEGARTTWAIPVGAPVGYGTARAADGSQVVTAVAGLVDGVPVVEILDVTTPHQAAAGVAAWAHDGPLAVDPSGASAPLASELVKLQTGQEWDLSEPPATTIAEGNLLLVSSRDYSAACANVVDALKPRGIRYRQHPDLDAAVAVAGKQKLGSDGGFVWAHSAGGAPIAALKAATLALWAVGHRPRTAPAPLTAFSGAAQ